MWYLLVLALIGTCFAYEPIHIQNPGPLAMPVDASVIQQFLSDLPVSFFERPSPEYGNRIPIFPFHTDPIDNINSISLTVTPQVVQRNRDQVTVRWAGLKNAGPNDWIGLYTSPDASHSDYLDYIPVRGQSEGSFTFPLVNIRRSFHFRLFQKIENNYYYVTSSASFGFLNDNEPVQGHIALTENVDEMRVHFVSQSDSAPMVEYGTQPGKYEYVATGSSCTYTNKMMCNFPATFESSYFWIDPGFMHNVLLSGLQPETQYYYRYGQQGMWSDEATFVSAPLKGKTSTQFIAFGDYGPPAFPGANFTNQRIKSELPGVDYILHFGDISYALGRGYVWDLFMTMIQPYAQRVPYMVSIGNHDYGYVRGVKNDPSGVSEVFQPEWGNYNTDSLGECSVPTYHRFSAPATGHSLFWYSFDYAHVHVIQMSTEHDFTKGSVQYNWLVKDLQAVDRSVTPWIVLTGHRPMYNSEQYKSDFTVAEHIRMELEELFLQYGVDLALWGHYHSYQRTCRAREDRCASEDETGIVHITVGSAGASLDDVALYDVEWDVYTEFSFGFGKVAVQGDTLRFNFVRSEDGVVSDWFELTKKENPRLGSVVSDSMHH